MNRFLDIGIISKPQGIRGEVRIKTFSGENDRLTKLKSVFIDGKEIKVLGIKNTPNGLIFAFDGITDRNAAESMRNKTVSVKREDLPPLPKDTYYHVDLIGAQIICDGKIIGNVTDIAELKTDVFTVKCTDGKILRFPFLKKAITSIDLNSGIIEVDKKIFWEISVYED